MENRSPSDQEALPADAWVSGKWNQMLQGQHFLSAERSLVLCFPSFLANRELRPVLWRKLHGIPDITHRLQIPPSDLHDDRYGSTWTEEVTATLPAYLCNSYPFYWSRPPMAHTVTIVSHIPQTCSLLKSLYKYC